MTDIHEHDHAEMKSRLIGYVETGEDSHIEVEHLFDNATCPEHGGLAHKGLVGVTIHYTDYEEGEEKWASALLGVRDALLLADRITRAAHLALELEEDLPDVEREVLRHSEHRGEEEGTAP